MISMSSLERRLTVLERPYLASIDSEKLLIQALDALDDTELGILEEFYSLQQSGFPSEEISGMMGEESYQAAIAAIEKADREYKQLIEGARHNDILCLQNRVRSPNAMKAATLEDIDREVQ